jgi:hypothetical protein
MLGLKAGSNAKCSVINPSPEESPWNSGMKARLKEIATSIETWASESDDRVQLLIMLIWLAFGLLAILLIVVIAMFVLPPEAWSL